MSWISIEDKLPKEHEYYLVANDSGDVFVAHYSFGRWTPGYYNNVFCDITHWMELPKHPKYYGTLKI